MTDTLPTWHHGLVARWWAEFNTEGAEIPFFKGFIDRFGGPVLDVACGTGRLLVPYLQAGLDVDGGDISADMLAVCRERAARAGFSPALYHTPMHRLDLPRRYRTIVVCGAFGLGSTRDRDGQALRCFHRHLEPGGALLMDHYLPWGDVREWRCWPAQERANLPEPWPEAGARKRAANGEEIELRDRLFSLDPLDQSAVRQMRAILWRDGAIVREEQHSLLERFYFRNEMLDMLAGAGFTDVELVQAHDGGPVTAESTILGIVARRA